MRLLEIVTFTGHLVRVKLGDFSLNSFVEAQVADCTWVQCARDTVLRAGDTVAAGRRRPCASPPFPRAPHGPPPRCPPACVLSLQSCLQLRGQRSLVNAGSDATGAPRRPGRPGGFLPPHSARRVSFQGRGGRLLGHQAAAADGAEGEGPPQEGREEEREAPAPQPLGGGGYGRSAFCPVPVPPAPRSLPSAFPGNGGKTSKWSFS